MSTFRGPDHLNGVLTGDGGRQVGDRPGGQWIVLRAQEPQADRRVLAARHQSAQGIGVTELGRGQSTFSGDVVAGQGARGRIDVRAHNGGPHRAVAAGGDPTQGPCLAFLTDSREGGPDHPRHVLLDPGAHLGAPDDVRAVGRGALGGISVERGHGDDGRGQTPVVDGGLQLSAEVQSRDNAVSCAGHAVQKGQNVVGLPIRGGIPARRPEPDLVRDAAGGSVEGRLEGVPAFRRRLQGSDIGRIGSGRHLRSCAHGGAVGAIGITSRLRAGDRCELGRPRGVAGAGRQLDDLSERVGEPQRRIDPRRRQASHENLTDQDRGQGRQQEAMAEQGGARRRALRMLSGMPGDIPGLMRRALTTQEPAQQENRRSQRKDGDGGESNDKSRRYDARLR